MQRGFKAKAERISAEVRESLGLGPAAPLCPWALADHFGVLILELGDLPLAANDVEQLTKVDPEGWSGLTIKGSGLVGVIINPAHKKPRQRSTLMHELSHIHLEHLGNRVDISEDGILLVSDYSTVQEDEANWLAAALLAPRDALLAARLAGKSPQQICQEYGISTDLCVWRLRMTGIEAQLQHRRRKNS